MGDNFVAELGDTIKRLRTERRWSQRELGHRADISNSTISLIEQGKTENPEAATLNKIADALEVPRTILLEQVGILEKDPQANEDLARVIVHKFMGLDALGQRVIMKMLEELGVGG